MALNDIVNKAKDLIEKRGGTDALKKDAEELKNIVTGTGTPAEKAKEAFNAVKDPGAAGGADKAEKAE